MGAPRGGPWAGARLRGSSVPREGWKLHVSATVGSATEVLRRALPVIVEEGVPFKMAVSRSALAALNEGEGGVAQAGKFLTVYPFDAEQAVRLAVVLDAATAGLAGPSVVTDRALRPGSIVSYRYGLFGGRGEEPDPTPPDQDPFLTAGVVVPEERSALAARYVTVRVMHRSVGGSVVLAADVRSRRPCVLKRAHRDARVGPDGRDARDHLRHEASVLERLAPDPRFPAVFELVPDGDDLVLVMEHLEGRTLGTPIAGPRSTSQVVALARAVVATLARIHHQGFAYRDLSPGNVLVDGETVRLVDFELACELGGVGQVAGTPGFASPEQLSGRPAAIADDVYALGGLIRFLATGIDPDAEDTPIPDACLSRIVARSRDGDVGARYGSMEEMDRTLAEMQTA